MTKRHAKNLIIEMPDDPTISAQIAALSSPGVDIWHEHSRLSARRNWIFNRMVGLVFARQIIADACGKVDSALAEFASQTERRAA